MINLVYDINGLDGEFEYKVCSHIYYKIIRELSTSIEDIHDCSTTRELRRSNNRLNPEVEVIPNIGNVKVYIGSHKVMDRTFDDMHKEV